MTPATFQVPSSDNTFKKCAEVMDFISQGETSLLAEDLDSLDVILKKDLKDLDRTKYSLYHRLKSIQEDAMFVSRIYEESFLPFPIVGNERCGTWYVDPKKALSIAPVYFKSTDGHYGRWDFNMRRANLHVLPSIEVHKGIVIVDSTRRGKRLPDALSKTIPIWCCVINRAIKHKTKIEWDTALYTPPSVVSPSERSQIELSLDKWALKLLESSFDLPTLSKPLRPIWIVRSLGAGTSLNLGEVGFFPVICLSASEQTLNGIERRHGYHYVQGSGDDHESWSEGLNPRAYWESKEDFDNCVEGNIQSLLKSVLAKPPHLANIMNTVTPLVAVSNLIEIGHNLDLSSGSALSHPTITVVETSNANEEESKDVAGSISPMTLVLSIPAGKAGQFAFMQALPKAIEFAVHHAENKRFPLRILHQGQMDHSLGVCMAVLQCLFDEVGSLRPEAAKKTASKLSIRRRLEWIQQSYPQANPSRTTMNRVNEYFMTPLSWRSR